MKRSLLNRVRGYTKAYVYLLLIRTREDSCVKIGFTTNLDERLAYYPNYLNADLLDYVEGSKQKMWAFEQYIHSHKSNKYKWKASRTFSGYTECYAMDKNMTDLRKLYYRFNKKG